MKKIKIIEGQKTYKDLRNPICTFEGKEGRWYHGRFYPKNDTSVMYIEDDSGGSYSEPVKEKKPKKSKKIQEIEEIITEPTEDESEPKTVEW